METQSEGESGDARDETLHGLTSAARQKEADRGGLEERSGWQAPVLLESS